MSLAVSSHSCHCCSFYAVIVILPTAVLSVGYMVLNPNIHGTIMQVALMNAVHTSDASCNGPARSAQHVTRPRNGARRTTVGIAGPLRSQHRIYEAEPESRAAQMVEVSMGRVPIPGSYFLERAFFENSQLFPAILNPNAILLPFSGPAIPSEDAALVSRPGIVSCNFLAWWT